MRRLGVAVAVLAAVVPGVAHAQSLERLPRAVFDVIPPEARVEGRRGDVRVVQRACRVGPTEWAGRRIVDIAVQEWAAFGFQTVDARVIETRRLPDGIVPDAVNPLRVEPRQGRVTLRAGRRETSRAVDAAIAGYWSATADGPRIIGRQNPHWSGEGEIAWVQPWSAAFISWVMCEAGLGDMDQFARHISHRVYIDQAIAARDGQAPATAYVAHDPGEAPIAPGDLVCNARGGARYRSLDDRRADAGAFATTHCDIVVRVGEDRINVIGGNVDDGVTLTVLPLTREGAAHPRPVSADDIEGARTVFAHLKLRAEPLEPDAMDRSPTLRALAD